jgi:hypothetical protein
MANWWSGGDRELCDRSRINKPILPAAAAGCTGCNQSAHGRRCCRMHGYGRDGRMDDRRLLYKRSRSRNSAHFVSTWMQSMRDISCESDCDDTSIHRLISVHCAHSFARTKLCVIAILMQCVYSHMFNRVYLVQLFTDYLFGSPWDSQLKSKASRSSNIYGYVFAFEPTDGALTFPYWMG